MLQLQKNGLSDSEIKIRLAQATLAMVRLTTILNSKCIRFKLKYNLYRSLVLSILTYGCESWTISALSTKKLQGFENKSRRKLIGITIQGMVEGNRKCDRPKIKWIGDIK